MPTFSMLIDATTYKLLNQASYRQGDTPQSLARTILRREMAAWKARYDLEAERVFRQMEEDNEREAKRAELRREKVKRSVAYERRRRVALRKTVAKAKRQRARRVR